MKRNTLKSTDNLQKQLEKTLQDWENTVPPFSGNDEKKAVVDILDKIEKSESLLSAMNTKNIEGCDWINQLFRYEPIRDTNSIDTMVSYKVLSNFSILMIFVKKLYCS